MDTETKMERHLRDQAEIARRDFAMALLDRIMAHATSKRNIGLAEITPLYLPAADLEVLRNYLRAEMAAYFPGGLLDGELVCYGVRVLPQ